jgi:MFS family permease
MLAVAKNIATMLVARFLDGLAGSAFLSVAGGSVGDMFPRERLQAPMMVYTASPFIGPGTNHLHTSLSISDSCIGLGPIIGGFINYNVSWRWSFYVLLIWSGIMLVAIIFLVPET